MWRTVSGLEPLVALYRQSALPTIDDALARGERSARVVASRLRVAVLTELPSGCSTGAFLNVNTREDLAHARTVAASEKPTLAAR